MSNNTTRYWLTTKQVAQLLQLEDTRTVVAMCRDEEAPLRGAEISYRNWRIDPASVAVLLGCTLDELYTYLNTGGTHGIDREAAAGP